MKDFVKKFFGGNRILNKRDIKMDPNKPFEFSYWGISRKLCIFIKNFAEKFFAEN